MDNKPVLRKKILNIFKYIAFTSIGIFLFWLVYRDQDFTQIWNKLKNEVNYNWVALSLIFGLLSHVSRTLRWKIALEPLGEHPKTSNAFITVMAAYFMNILVPRMGEVARCTLMSKYEKISFSKLFGTVVTERIVDLIMLIFAFIIVVVLEMDKMITFTKANPSVIENGREVLSSPFLWIGIVVAIIGIIVFFKSQKGKKGKSKIHEIIDGFTQGIKSVLKMKRKWAYIGHTFFIWLMYFMMLYVVFFSMEITESLPAVAGLTTFVLASFGMVAPVQAGIGPWHFMTREALHLYQIPRADGEIFALLAHSSMNLMVILTGAICIIALPIINRNYNPKNQKTK